MSYFLLHCQGEIKLCTSLGRYGCFKTEYTSWISNSVCLLAVSTEWTIPVEIEEILGRVVVKLCLTLFVSAFIRLLHWLHLSVPKNTWEFPVLPWDKLVN